MNHFNNIFGGHYGFYITSAYTLVGIFLFVTWYIPAQQYRKRQRRKPETLL